MVYTAFILRYWEKRVQLPIRIYLSKWVFSPTIYCFLKNTSPQDTIVLLERTATNDTPAE
jgi:hypothetical protein